MSNYCYECGAPVFEGLHFCGTSEGGRSCSVIFFEKYATPREAKIALAKITRLRKKQKAKSYVEGREYNELFFYSR